MQAAVDKDNDGNRKVEKVEEEPGGNGTLWMILINFAPFLFIIGIWVSCCDRCRRAATKR
jgi:hypothetical protein